MKKEQGAGGAGYAAREGSIGGGSTRTRVLLWVLAVVITLAAAVYQRMHGPTVPLRGEQTVAGEEIRYRLVRSMVGQGNYEIRLNEPSGSLTGELSYRRYPTDDPWTRIPLRRSGEDLVGLIPVQPPGGKVAYRFHLGKSPEGPLADLPEEGPVVGRFRGSVPAFVMIPHVLFMFLSMLWSNRAGLEGLRRGGDPRKLAYWAFGILVVGGLVFGPLVQWYAFGEFWTGFPVGYDLTDNKTLIAAVAWLAAVLVCLRAGRSRRGAPLDSRTAAGARASREAAAGSTGLDPRAGVPSAGLPSLTIARAWVIFAALVTLVIFSIPHSVAGTELDYSSHSEGAQNTGGPADP